MGRRGREGGRRGQEGGRRGRAAGEGGGLQRAERAGGPGAGLGLFAGRAREPRPGSPARAHLVGAAVDDLALGQPDLGAAGQVGLVQHLAVRLRWRGGVGCNASVGRVRRVVGTRCGCSAGVKAAQRCVAAACWPAAPRRSRRPPTPARRCLPSCIITTQTGRTHHSAAGPSTHLLVVVDKVGVGHVGDRLAVAGAVLGRAHRLRGAAGGRRVCCGVSVGLGCSPPHPAGRDASSPTPPATSAAPAAPAPTAPTAVPAPRQHRTRSRMSQGRKGAPVVAGKPR